MIRWLAAAAVAFSSAPASAITVYGIAGDACSTWHVANPYIYDPRYNDQLNWLGGFIAGANVFGPNRFDITRSSNLQGMAAWMDRHCTSHPLDLVGDAAVKLVHELERRR